MGKVLVLPSTTLEPISTMGARAGICWGGDVSSKEKNYKRGLDCIKSGHGRVMEYVNVETVIEGYSARVIREWYTHIGGAPTRLQSSTRYIDYADFKYIVPESIAMNDTARDAYIGLMSDISEVYAILKEEGIPKEDIGMILPMAMETKIVDRRNLRNIIDMSAQRLCARAYSEYRELFGDYLSALRSLSDEWATVIDMCCKPKCDALGYCPETRSCGRMPQKS